MHALLINSAKSFPLNLLSAYPEIDSLSVISETPYAHRYTGYELVESVADIYDLTSAVAAARAIMRVRPVDRVIAPAERALPAAGLIRSLFAIPGAGFDVCQLFSNKYAMKVALRAAGLPVTSSRQVQRLADVPGAAASLGWPVVVKPVYGGGGQDTFVLRGRREYGEFAASTAADGLRGYGWPLIVESFVEMDDEYHCDGIVHDGEVRFAAVSRYFMPLLDRIDDFTGSVTVPGGAPEHAAITELHRRAVAALGLRAGVTHLELFRTGDGFLIGEITCRPAGGGIPEAIEIQYGVDLWRAFIDTSLGIEPRIDLRPYPGIVANCDLPIRPGLVTGISAEAELAGLPGVLRASMTTKAGDVVDSHLHSSSTTGLVFLGLSHPGELAGRLAALASAYRLETAPQPGTT